MVAGAFAAFVTTKGVTEAVSMVAGVLAAFAPPKDVAEADTMVDGVFVPPKGMAEADTMVAGVFAMLFSILAVVPTDWCSLSSLRLCRPGCATILQTLHEKTNVSFEPTGWEPEQPVIADDGEIDATYSPGGRPRTDDQGEWLIGDCNCGGTSCSATLS